MYFYGDKLHAVCGISGVFHSYDIMAADVHDLKFTDDLKWEYSYCTMLGDKAYLSAEIQQTLFDTAKITLEVPYRLNQKNWKPASWTYRRFRKRIETCFSQLNDQLLKMISTVDYQSVKYFLHVFYTNKL
ncbi:MAG: transposase [Bacteroidales bacterium]|nr:transposase [Bacteroidales bacterium]